MPVGSASEYPHCFLNINKRYEKKRVVNQILSQVKNKLKVIKPKFFFPAGGNYILYGKFLKLDKFIATPSFSDIVKKASVKGTKIVNLLSKKIVLENNIVKIKKLNPNSFYKNRKELKLKFKKFKYEYENKNLRISISNLDKLYNESLKKYYSRLNKGKMNTSWKIDFYLYRNLQLVDANKILKNKNNLLKKYTLNYNNRSKKKQTLLECYLDIKLFILLLKRIHPWNPVLSGSMILFKRYPNKFDPNVTYSLNYLGL